MSGSDFTATLATIRSKEELSGFAWSCRQQWSKWEMDDEKSAALALRKIEMEMVKCKF